MFKYKVHFYFLSLAINLARIMSLYGSHSCMTWFSSSKISAPIQDLHQWHVVSSLAVLLYIPLLITRSCELILSLTGKSYSDVSRQGKLRGQIFVIVVKRQF